MDINTDINILGGVSDYNLIRIYIAGEAEDKSSDEIQHQYTSIKTEKAFKRFQKAIDKSVNSFKSRELKDMIQTLCNMQELDETMLLMFFWNMSLNNELFAYLCENVYFPILNSGRTVVTAEDVLACLKELKQGEPVLQKWSESTLQITASKYLTVMKKLGLLDGSIKKKIIYKNLSKKQFILFLYWLMQAEDTTNIGESVWMKYGFMEKKYFIERCLQHKYTKYIDINYNGEILRAEPKLTYKEICHECQ
ncbi:MAG TPA: DUF1819 family protein [Lachnospiraceae bacterium]|nr:hypothetical protein [Bacteroidales bacterium]HUM85197.1 DUF1819 family protein [Lachnospiraceae bacterium]